MALFIETLQLWLREFTKSDADDLYELGSDPEVTCYNSDPPEPS